MANNISYIQEILDRIDTAETNIIILSAVFGSICALLFVILCVLSYMVSQLRGDIKRIGIAGAHNLSSADAAALTSLPHLGRDNSVYSAPLPRVQSLTAENLRTQDAAWNQNLGYKNFRQTTDRPFPLAQRAGNPGAAYNNNMGY